MVFVALEVPEVQEVMVLQAVVEVVVGPPYLSQE
jgi:hypothetical protein